MQNYKIVFICICLLISTVVSRPLLAQDLTDAEKRVLYKSQQLILKDKLEKARENIQTYLKENKNKKISPELFIFLGNSCYDYEKYEKAAKYYHQGMKIHPHNLSLILNYAVSSYRSHDYIKAAKSFRTAYALKKRQKDKNDLSLLFKSATSFYRGQALEESKDLLHQLLSVSQKANDKWMRLLIQINYELSDWKSLERNIKEFLRQNPEAYDYWKLLAQTYLEQEKYLQAAGILEICYQMQPPETKKWEQLAQLYAYINAPQKAAQAFRQAYGQNLTPDQCDRLAQLHFRSLEYDQALSCIEQALEKEPTAKRYYMQGEIYYRSQKYKQAIQSFSKSVERAPGKGKAYMFLGLAAIELEDWQRALQAFQQAQKDESFAKWAQANIESIQELLNLQETAQLKAESSSQVSS